MASSTSSLGSGGAGGVTPLTLNGISQYASDFQSILNRSVEVASIPIQQLQAQQSLVDQQMTAASSLNGSVAAVAADLGKLGTLGSSGALTASSSDNSVVTAQVTGATTNASYAITNVTSVASAAAESSLSSYTDATTIPVSATGSLQLTVGSTNYPITLASGSNNLTGLESAINGLNAGVTAQILTTAGGDYLSVSANNPGATTLQLADDPGGVNKQLLTSLNQGTDTVFQLNGIPVDTPQTTINNIIPGLTFTINGTTTTGQTVNVSLSSDSSQVSSVLQSFVNDYNTLAQQVNAQSGTGGALEGDSAIWQLRNAMLQLASYNSPAGSIHSLADLGVTFDQTGTASFSATNLSSLSSSQVNDVFKFLGSATSGLGALSAPFSEISDPTSGSIASEISSWSKEAQKLTTSIGNATTQVNTMQQLLSKQLEAADAQVSELQSQQSLLTSSIQSLDYSTYGAQVTQPVG